MSGEAVRYAYEPLKENEIRILSPLPGLPGADLRCFIKNSEFSPPRIYGNNIGSRAWSPERGGSEDELSEDETSEGKPSQHESLDNELLTVHQRRMSANWTENNERLDYEALSYVWGCQEPPRSLWLSGKNSGLLSIGPNLYDALERLRPVPGQEARTLWADQICINQTDLEERNAHVLMMGDIFKGARKVLIWLGQERVYGTTGGYLIPDDEDRLRLSKEFENRIPKKNMDHHLDRFGNDGMEWGITQWCAAATRKITYRSWFERTWTYQELMLAQDAELICGPCSLPWIVMGELLSVRGRHDLYQPNQQGLELTEYLVFSQQSVAFSSMHGGVSFRGLLSSRKISKCSGPRDKVVALLGLADDLNHGVVGSGSKSASAFIRPDYQKPVEDLYLKTAHYLLQSTHSLEFLWCAITTPTLNKLPSWVPDWRFTEWPKGTPSAWFQQATRGSPHHLFFSGNILDSTRLRVSSIRQECISALTCYDENFPEEFFQPPRDLEVYLPTMQPMGLAVKQTMMREEWANTDHAARAAFFDLSTSVTSNEVAEESVHTFEDQLDILGDEFYERDSTAQMFRGSKGFIGYGPRSMQVGDEIHLLLGFDCPVALRPTEGCYRFVGCCYVHGLMYGEGLHPGRRPSLCNYPGSSSLDEFWPLLWSEQKVKERNACRSPRWLTFQRGETEALTYFEDHFEELIKDGYILSLDWQPPQTPGRQQALWLLEKGFDPIPILTEDVFLV